VRSYAVLSLLVLLAVLATSMPAAAVSDTTPPQLVSLSVTPNQVDASNSDQLVTVSANITDDLSGVCAQGDSCPAGTSQVQLFSPSGQQQAVTGFFAIVSGDSYTATVTLKQYAEEGIWKDWHVWLFDKAGNYVVLDEYDLLRLGTNVAVGVGTFDASYPRTISLRLSRTKASGYVQSDVPSTCFWFIPVLLERRTSSGWKKAGSTLSLYDGYYRVRINKPGKYRATATEFGIGSPTLTTCSKVSAVGRLS
jgi:hypothetical protein